MLLFIGLWVVWGYRLWRDKADPPRPNTDADATFENNAFDLRLQLQQIEHKIELSQFDKRLGVGVPQIIEEQKKSGLTPEEYIFRFMDSIPTGSPQTVTYESLKRDWFGIGNLT